MTRTHERKLDQLTSRWLDGGLSDDEFAQLQVMLSEDASARARFFGHVTIQSRLMTDGKVLGEVDEVLDRSSEIASWLPIAGDAACSSSTELAPLDPSVRRRFQRGALARGVAIAASLLVVAYGASSIVRESPVAQVERVSEGCEWMFDDGDESASESAPGSIGVPIYSGSTLRVASGDLSMRFSNDVSLSVFGPALVAVDSEMRVRMLSGRMRARVAKGAEGFSVDVPQGKVIDLGTEFGIEVDSEGRSDVVVFDGKVNVDMPSANQGAPGTQALVGGEAMRLDRGKWAGRLSSVWSGRFESSKQVPERAARKPLIVAVDDNLDLVWKFYEIAHGAMGEDARALVSPERPDEWNGLTHLGMPEYLIGGDYVRTFRDDHMNDDIQIRVTLAAPSRLFVLFDARSPPPAWLESGFFRNGDRLGLDMGPWDEAVDGDYEYGDGPGESIDRVADVWESRGPVSGVVELGATESLVVGTLMYGIVAQPAGEFVSPPR